MFDFLLDFFGSRFLDTSPYRDEILCCSSLILFIFLTYFTLKYFTLFVSVLFGRKR